MENNRLLGISIYPSYQDVDEMKKYIGLAEKLGYKRIFSSMLEMGENHGKTLEKFRKIFSHAKQKGFDVCLDVNSNVFSLIGAKISDLRPFFDLNVSTIRIDAPMDGKSESEMSFNPYGINIEINISNGTEYISNLMSYKPKKDKIIGCHNFYPQPFSGLDYNFFIKATKLAKKHGIRTAAFVASKSGKQGPWGLVDGLPTLEIHRNKDISLQARHLWATGLIDDIVIGNPFASEDELKSLSKVDPYFVSLEVETVEKISEIEKVILFDEFHFRRGDKNDFTIRSTMSRVFYKKENFPPHDNLGDQRRGDIFIGNNNFGTYKGELQLIINEIKSNNNKNLIARIKPDNLFLLDYIDSWDKFKFINKERND